MKDHPRVFPIWSLPILILIVCCLVQCGCITKKGHGLGGGYIKGEDGIYRKPKSSQTIHPAKSPPIKQAPLKAIYEPPDTEVIKKQSASPILEPKDIKSAGKLEKIPPSILEPKKKISLGLITIELPEGNEGETNTSTETITTGNPPPVSSTETANTPVKIHWGKLFLFYLNFAVVLGFIYVIYKVIKGHVLWKEPDIQKHIKKISKPKKTSKKKMRRTKTK